MVIFACIAMELIDYQAASQNKFEMNKMLYIPSIERNIMASNFSLGVSCVLILRRSIVVFHVSYCFVRRGKASFYSLT